MRYREYVPHPRLTPWVKCYWTLQSPAADLMPIEPVFPDGSMELIFHRGDRFRKRRPVARKERPGSGASRDIFELQERALLAGQMTGPIELQPTGETEVLGIRFHPAGAASLFSMPLHEWTDHIRPLQDAWDRRALEWQHLALDAVDLPTALGGIERKLLQQLGHRRPSNRIIKAENIIGNAVKFIDRTGGNVTVDQLAIASGYGRRQLERLFQSHVGVSPKQLCRIVRFQTALAHTENCPKPDWAAVAQATGYCDQAHLIRDFRQFSGMTPSVLTHQDYLLGDAM